MTRLTDRRVSSIVHGLEIGFTQTYLAEYFGISHQLVSCINLGKRRAYASGGGVHREPLITRTRNPARRITAKQVLAIRKALGQGEKQEVIAKRLNIGQSTVSNIARGKVWRHVT